MMKKIAVLLTLIVLAISLSPVSVFAIADPDSPPRLDSVYVYDLADGGIGVFCKYYLEYAILPTVADPNDIVTNAYLVSFIDTDGVTTLRATQPYTYVDSGYGYGVAWIRFSAAEVISMSIDSADEALYTVSISGNPTIPSGWVGDPPETIASVTDWYTTGDPEVLLATQVRIYADELEIAWSVDLIEASALGSVLTSNGENYWLNAIPGLKILAPAVFSSSEITPELEEIIYDTDFSAVAASVAGGATVVGSPQTLVVGANTVDTGATTGDITITLSLVARGTIADGTGTFVGISPATLVSGVNTIDVDGAGTFTVTLTQTDLQAQIDAVTDGTGFDTSAGATIFGMTTGVFSTALWLIMGVILIGASYGGYRKANPLVNNEATGKTAMFLYALWMLGGMLMGVLLAKIMLFLFIGYGAFIGYILFYRNSAGDTGRNVAFMGWMWVIVCLAGGMLNGIVPHASTHLTTDLTSAGTTINVASTEGFRQTGILIISEERIAYSDTTATTFVGTTFRPMVRGTSGTEAVAHSSGAVVRMPESSLINDSLSYRIALISDAAGLMSFVTIPLAVFNIITDFVFLPLSFLGTDLVIVTVIWGIIALGTIITFAVAMTGGRRI